MAQKLYFVGAGLSKSLEKPCKPIPLMFDFVSVMAEHLDSQVILATLAALEIADLYEWKSEGAKQIAEQIAKDLRKGQCPAGARAQFKRALQNRPWESIEDLLERSLTSQSTSRAAWHSQQLPQKFRYAINQLFSLIGWDVNWCPLEEFLERQFQGDDSHAFVSFNYDLLLDRAIQKIMSDWNVQSGYGFSMEYCVDPDGSMMAQAFPQVQSPSKVLILKPHGSLNWLVPEKMPIQHGPGGTASENGPVTVPLSPSGELRYFGSTETFRWIGLPNDLPRDVEIYIIPPIAVAKSQALPFVREVRQHEQEAVAKADEVYVIGWSLPETDKDQEALLRSSIRKRAHPIGSLTIVNYGARPSYFRHVADVFGVNDSSVRVFNAGFAAFVDSI